MAMIMISAKTICRAIGTLHWAAELSAQNLAIRSYLTHTVIKQGVCSTMQSRSTVTRMHISTMIEVEVHKYYSHN